MLLVTVHGHNELNFAGPHDARAGTPIVFVLGQPTYYPRFGFEPAAPFDFVYERPVRPDAFMLATCSRWRHRVRAPSVSQR
ncbi:MAG TPA: hypothetical protein VNM48_14915, partial [Chloroflexota bacterium]|nr:hypothetical protein [Chloroflexota bacterium]